ncbi:Short-chain dehydrogenase [Madurella fahalii]|uniref:Short-chain dehydrogenase n=1 Tax=Madurella fahalii TaxID=1157608 RepID=A0ABQ0GT82_9PEZI
MAPSSISVNVPYIKTLHKKPYPAISPLRPELSQTGKTVLIVGGSSGIGFAIAKAFAQASASHVILTGRREAVLSDSVARLQAETRSSGTKISGFVCDLTDPQASENLWKGFRDAAIVVDVLVLNAMSSGEAKPILQARLDSTWKVFETNVRGLLHYAQCFYEQGGNRPKYIVNVSSTAIHNFTTESSFIPTYALTKGSGTLLMQQIAKDTDPKEMQIVSFHPGGILSESAKNVGYDESSLDWDDVDLPGRFAVWCATEAARFLHGRFVPVWWDVDELGSGEVRERIESDCNFLRIGVVGF